MLVRSYYSDYVTRFLKEQDDLVFSQLVKNHQFSLEEQQRNAWIMEIRILKKELINLPSTYLLLEYAIPRMGKRADAILIIKDIVIVIEFKVHEEHYKNNDLDQCLDYALDLKYFHRESHNMKIIPILVATDAVHFTNTFEQYPDGIFKPIRCNRNNLNEILQKISQQFGKDHKDPMKWITSTYMPTPTIIEAAQALYQGHNVKEISRSDSSAQNLVETAETINRIIEKSKKEKVKSICFITGVPGSGKTLAGLNLANERHKFSDEEHAVFLSGNGPLVEVLQEALARNRVENSLGSIKKNDALRQSKAFIQNIHNFRDEALRSADPPIEKVVVFDEAQRAWNQKQTSSFMQRKRGIDDFIQSEPEFLISIMNRHKDWCVIACLIGGGQEINTGEAGLLEWFSVLKRKFNQWQVYVSSEISDIEYLRNTNLETIFEGIKCEYVTNLHLKVSLRSFRSENVSKVVKSLLDCETVLASQLISELKEKYPIIITRDIIKAKEWLKQKARASERYGLIASSKALRLKPYGVFVELKIDAKNWFLNSKNDVRSSYFLEYSATEFDIQGLELDWVCVAWDADLRYEEHDWNYYQFRGKVWQNIRDKENMLFLKNSYRVLLTRARQGLIIFIPYGDKNDQTRIPSFYDETYSFLKKIGIQEL